MNRPPMMAFPATKDFYGTWQSFMGVAQPDQLPIPKGLRDFGRVPADESWVYSCSTIRSDAASGVPLRVQVKDGKTWVDNENTSNTAAHDYQTLLDDVNPGWDGGQLQTYIEAGAAIHGGSYLRKVRGRFGGAPLELHWLSGALVTPRMGRSMPDSYDYKPDQQTVENYAAKDIIPLRDTVNLEDPYALLSPLSAARYEISTNKQATEWNTAQLANWGIPAGAWVADKDADLGPQEQSAIRRALRALRGSRNQGKTPILPSGLTWVPLSMSQKDADWIASRKISRMAICAVLGVPLVLAGDDEKSGVYGSIRDAERVFWRRKMIPSMDRRAIQLDSWLTPDFDPTRKVLRVRYDYTGIEALRAAPAEEQAAWREWVKLGLPLNRGIAEFGLGDPVEGGDESRVLLRLGDVGLTAGDQSADAPPATPVAAGPKPRPAEYNTAAASGNEPPARKSVRDLGAGLYRDDSVKAFLADGDTAHLHDIEGDTSLLATGLKRRYSADQITDGVPAEGFAGLEVPHDR